MSEKSDEEISRIAFDNCLRRQASPAPPTTDGRGEMQKLISDTIWGNAFKILRRSQADFLAERIMRALYPTVG